VSITPKLAKILGMHTAFERLGWNNTQIVKLLRLAETNTDKIGDMTSLTRAGEFIKSQDPECTPKKYGIKTLKGVLKVSGLFEIIDSQNGVCVLYKSKVLQ
jgi:hypothetical protein